VPKAFRPTNTDKTAPSAPLLSQENVLSLKGLCDFAEPASKNYAKPIKFLRDRQGAKIPCLGKKFFLGGEKNERGFRKQKTRKKATF